MRNEKSLLQEKVNKLVSLYEKDFLKEALIEAKTLINQYSNVAIIHNISGIINLAIGSWNEAINNFKEAIKINPTYAEGHYNLGIALDNLNLLEDAVINYSKAIELKPNFVNAHESLIRILTFYNPKQNISNQYVKTNKLLQNINYNYDSNKKILDNDVINFFNTFKKIIFENINLLNYNETEIFRSNTIDLKCERHFKIFNTFNIIPEYCFGCFKVQIELKNVIELIKLYFIFDKLILKNNNPRKCMIELREKVSGSYKGFIYCSSLGEANEIKNKLSNILSKQIHNNVQIKVKRGCSEFAVSYPKYKNINESDEDSMKYNKKWKSKEKLIDDQLAKRNQSKQRVLRNNLPGVTICDALIIRNWIIFAKINGDLSYEKIIKESPIPNDIVEGFNKLLIRRKKLLSSSPD